MTESREDKNRGRISGLYLRVGGDMVHDGTIQTDRDSSVDITVRGNYTSNNGKIIQGESKVTDNWYQKWWMKFLIFPVIVGLIILLITSLL